MAASDSEKQESITLDEKSKPINKVRFMEI